MPMTSFQVPLKMYDARALVYFLKFPIDKFLWHRGFQNVHHYIAKVTRKEHITVSMQPF